VKEKFGKGEKEKKNGHGESERFSKGEKKIW
jgi:hypothetical protein